MCNVEIEANTPDQAQQKWLEEDYDKDTVARDLLDDPEITEEDFS